MIARGKPHPALLFVFAPVVVTAIAVYIAGWRWPGLAAGMPGTEVSRSSSAARVSRVASASIRSVKLWSVPT